MSNVADELKKLVTTHMEEAWRAGERGKAHICDFKELEALIHRTQLESQIEVLESIKQATRQAYAQRALISIESMNDTMAVHTNAVVENALLCLKAALEKQA